MPNYCTVCGLSKSTISLFRLPKEPGWRKTWLENLGLLEQDLTTESRICSRHFRDGNPQNMPSLHIEKEFSAKPTNITPRESAMLHVRQLKYSQQNVLALMHPLHLPPPLQAVSPTNISTITSFYSSHISIHRI